MISQFANRFEKNAAFYGGAYDKGKHSDEIAKLPSDENDYFLNRYNLTPDEVTLLANSDATYALNQALHGSPWVVTHGSIAEKPESSFSEGARIPAQYGALLGAILGPMATGGKHFGKAMIGGGAAGVALGALAGGLMGRLANRDNTAEQNAVLNKLKANYSVMGDGKFPDQSGNI